MHTVYSHDTWRLIHSAPTVGAMNMAIDEAILKHVTAGHAPPTLRFYAWQPACLSLGVAQSYTDCDRDRLAARGWHLVRRPTGGKAILHIDELTYSVAAAKTEARVAGGVIESYRRLSRGLMAGLEALGLGIRADRQADDVNKKDAGPVCFEVPSHYEITVNGKKLVGSAQVRKHKGVLQHGTLPLFGDVGRICEVLVFDSQAARDAARQRVAGRAATLAESLGTVVSWDQAALALAEGFRRALNLTLAPAALSHAEQASAQELYDSKYAHTDWTYRR